MNRYRLMFSIALLFVLGFALAVAVPRYELNNASELVPYKYAERGPVDRNVIDEVDELFPVTRVGSTAEYYLGSGAAGDTFAIVLEPVAACSVYTIQYQWNDGGNIICFVANYSQAGQDSFPNGRATARRGQTSVSPIGTIIRTFTPNTISTTNAWATVDVGSPFIVGNTQTGAPAKFVVGFIKSGAAPHPLADDVTARGYTYTWFGGPWNAAAPHRWGAYAGVTATTITDVMCRAMVAYAWGAPIIILNPKQLPNSYSQNGPYDFTVELYDDGAGITPADQINLKWRVAPDGAINTVPLTQRSGSTYGANFTSTTALPVGSIVRYWVEALDDGGRTSSSIETPQEFEIVAPTNNNAPLLIITDNLSGSTDGDRFEIFSAALSQIGINDNNYEVWDIATNNGIDGSVVNHGWNNIFVFGWGHTSIPSTTYTTSNMWNTFINAGKHLLFADQDYFYATGLSGAHTFVAGDFAYDKFGIATCVSDPDSLGDVEFDGTTGDPLTGQFSATPYSADPEGIFKYANASSASRHNWNDQITVNNGTVIFSGTNDGLLYGARRTIGQAKLVLLPMMLEAAANEDTAGGGDTIIWEIGNQLPAFLGAVNSWFGIVSAPEAVSLTPRAFAIESNYPNPFNPSTTIEFAIPNMSRVSLKVYNMAGQEVANLVNNDLFAGSYKVKWNASSLASGVYIAKLQSGNNVATRKLMLLK